MERAKIPTVLFKTNWQRVENLLRNSEVTQSDVGSNVFTYTRCFEAMCNASPESTMGDALSRSEMERMLIQPFRPELEKEWPYQVDNKQLDPKFLKYKYIFKTFSFGALRGENFTGSSSPSRI